MTTIDLNLLETLALATALFFVGQFNVSRSTFLQRYSIPVPVVGAVLAARLSKQRARTGITTPMHEGARLFFERSAEAQA